jgi:transcriptional regulator with XRE-family HTH domain
MPRPRNQANINFVLSMLTERATIDRGLTQQELAELTNNDRTTISRILKSNKAVGRARYPSWPYSYYLKYPVSSPPGGQAYELSLNNPYRDNEPNPIKFKVAISAYFDNELSTTNARTLAVRLEQLAEWIRYDIKQKGLSDVSE